ncbi:peptidase inhibitor family I36 protein [Streptomyces sp. NPDC047315]|uniref:peptidase inhibitor family I36 protein n=1 Tax=Streptomyces sp. NPDC047315 TaxID=3155142 RepID=UPI00340EBACE
MKSKRTTVAGVLAGACLTGTLAMTGAAPANAAPAAPADWRDCTTNSVCVWDHSNYNGAFLAGGANVPNVGTTMNDRTTSLGNLTRSRICFYDHSSYRGELLASVGPGEWRPNIGAHANDRITSWRTC